MGPPSPPRRITRDSLARYAYKVREQSRAATDIEDAIPSSSRKRKRLVTAASGTASHFQPTRVTADAQPKTEPDPPVLPNSTTSRPKRVRVMNDASSEHLEGGQDDDTLTLRPRRTRIRTQVNYEEDSRSESSSADAAPKKPPRRARRPARKVKKEDGEVQVEPPSSWLEMYDLVKQMRVGDGPAAKAPVDTMGCERLADRHVTPRDKRFQTLIALMLSSQTKDTVNAVVMRKLQTELEPHAPGAKPGLNLENILAVEPSRLNELIGLVGFHNNKTKYIKQAAILLKDKFAGDIPDTIDGLVSLPGVGPKMAHLCMSTAWDRTEGIGVDVHVHRITNLWGWNKTKNPEETRLALQSWLPRDKWREINWLLVGFGQTVCLPVGRKCGQCELGLQGLCRAADKKKVNEAKRQRNERTRVDDAGGK